MTLTALELDILRMLRRSVEPLSGRQVADITGVAPNTANRLLKALQSRELVRSTKAGRATLWTTTADVAGLTELEGSSQQRVALVVTAVELEHTEVRNRLLNVERVRKSDIWMIRGEVPGKHVNWDVYLARAGMGNATSAALVGIAAGELDANVVAFVGTAAGLKPADQKHLDVVVASRIHNPYAGKQVPSESGSQLLGRDPTYHVPAPLLTLVKACIEDTAWTSSPRSPHYCPGQPHAFVGPIVSVESVQIDPDGPVIQQVRSRFQDAAALDMESFGLAAGSDIHDLPVLAVRGLSDFVGDKSAAGNDDLQPKAAGNAAGLLRDILVYAHPDDFKRGGPRPPSESPDGEGEPGADPLPAAVQMWMDRLEGRSPARAASARAALVEMRRGGGTAATWLSRALYRPPAWLREDDTGDGWALVSSLASVAGSKVAWRGYEQAATSARLTGDIGVSAYFTVTARLDRIKKAVDAGDPLGEGALDGFDDDVMARFGDVIEFYRAVTVGDLVEIKARAEVALASLGLTDPFGVLRTPQGPIPQVDLEPALRNVTAATVLRQLAQMMLTPGAADLLGVQSGLAERKLRGNPVTRDLADDGLRLAKWAVSLCPNAEGARLIQAQTMLGVLVSMTGRTSADVEDEISKQARTVEADALQVRDVLRAWDGASGAAVAVAARARSMQGDFAGAMRLLLPAPDGLASPGEAKHPEVVRLGAYLARAVGNDDLALELAEKNPDRVEGALMRAAVLGGRPQMASEAKAALFAALEQSGDEPHSDFQVLMALSRRFNSLKESEQATVMRHIDGFGQRDNELADVMRARVALSQGDTEAALRYVRGMERNELALEAQADALVASGRSEEAAQLVFAEGMRRGDIPLAAEALEIAVRNGLAETARSFALGLLSHDDGKPVRLKALRALQRTAHGDSNWQDVASRTEQIIQEIAAHNLPVPEVEYWRLAEAQFFMEKFDKAVQVLLDAPAVSFNAREKAQLFLTALRRSIDEHRSRGDSFAGAAVADLGNPKLYAMFMRAAADWADDEQVAAAAMSVVLMTPGSTFTEVQIADFRAYMERYFERHGENATITQIKMEGDNLDALFEFLRKGNERQHLLEEFVGHVRAGQFPLAALTEVAGKTCTESLIRRDLGYVVGVDDDGRGERTAREALGRRVVVDTTALVVAPWTGHPFKKLAAHFDSIIVPAAVREDIARARSSLAMKSTATIGWDTRQQRPVVSETTPEEAQAHADAAEQVWTDVRGLQIERVADPALRDRWLSAVSTAQELGIPVWADDIVIRRFARAMGVPAFGSLDLIRAFGDEGSIAAAIASFRENKVVDIPIDEPWHSLANKNRWRVEGALGLAISRPAAWRDIPKSFKEFRSLIHRRPDDMDAQNIAMWTHQAANGLALALVPHARAKVVSTLLAWVIFFTDSFFTPIRSGIVADLPEDAGRVTELIIEVAEELRHRHYPGTESLEPLVDILCRGLLDSVGPEGTSHIVASLVERLSSETGSRVFAAYIQSAGM